MLEVVESSAESIETQVLEKFEQLLEVLKHKWWTYWKTSAGSIGKLALEVSKY